MKSTRRGNPGSAPDEVIQREQLLLQANVRASREQVLELLHPDFTEHGASGRTWDRLSIADALSSEVSEPITMDDVEGILLTEDVVLLTYTARCDTHTSLRSSLWLRTATGEWLLRFHQGTPTPQ